MLSTRESQEGRCWETIGNCSIIVESHVESSVIQKAGVVEGMQVEKMDAEVNECDGQRESSEIKNGCKINCC